MSTQKTTSFHDPPPDTEKYKKVIERAKARKHEPPPPLSGVQRFDQLPDDPPPGLGPGRERPTSISPETARGLEALGRAQPPAAGPAPAPEPPAAQAETAEGADEPEVEDRALRTAVEARVAPMDIGQYLMSGGEMTQAVPIVPGKLDVVFRTVTEYEEAYVDLQLAKEKDLETPRQYVRRQTEWAVAAYLHALNNTHWPSPLKPDGTVDDEVMQDRMRRVRRLPSPVFSLVSQNLAWFLERVSKALNFEALKNG